MSVTPREIYRDFNDCVVRLPALTPQGDHASGAAFHIGGGCLATARHNLVDGELQEEALGLEVRNVHFPKVEVNAVVDRYDGPHSHFIVSTIPRGGFSGGPVFREWGFLLGVMTASLFEGGKPSELGFAAAISVELLLALVHECQAPCLMNLEWANYFCGDGPIPSDAREFDG